MPSFESPLGTKNFGGTAMREYDVPDESGNNNHISYDAISEFASRMDSFPEQNKADIAQLEYEMKAAREAKRNNKERLNDGAKRRIEMLVGMTRLTRNVEIDNNVYVLQTLRSKELREAFMAAAAFDGSVQFPHELRRQLTGRSLIEISGMTIEQFIGSTDLNSKLFLMDELPEALLQRLFDEYQLLVKESTNKYGIKNEAEAKEVVEDLKK